MLFVTGEAVHNLLQKTKDRKWRNDFAAPLFNGIMKWKQ
ncbi:hypothetical protein M493_01425 [Geobacillus genomosp. 3]|uniref:Uncharacterized protein n=1 Tax=Geobacillus genomosp. 3 TaxID=1921421 RepID=S5Z8W7_GEOG3|nr:hypothetical protein M493_01425 [Geobacillus genomosp. 3]